MTDDRKSRLLAVAGLLCALVIWGGQFAASRFAIRTDLTPHDITALRYLVAAAILLPAFWRLGVADCGGVGWGRALALTVTAGAPFFTLSNIGLALAPASHGASIQPGASSLGTFALMALVTGVAPPRAMLAALAVVVAGLAVIGYAGSTGGGPSTLLGDLLFAVSGLCWATFTVLIQRWKIAPLQAAAVVSVMSTLMFVPPYVLWLEPRLLTAPVGVVAFHAVNQGLLNMVLGMSLFGFGVRVLGAGAASRFIPLVPVTGTLIAIPVLGEWPGPLQAAGVVLIVAGLLASTLVTQTR